jgi:hypothetical protein
MLFAVSPGSDGNGSDRFVASLPFTLSPGSVLELAETSSYPIPGGEHLKLEKLQLRYSASVGPYASESDAEQGLQRLTAALLWSALEFNVGLRYPSNRGLISLYESPIPITPSEPMASIGRMTGWLETDGHYDADSTVIRPEHKRLVRFEAGSATITAGVASSNFLAKLAEALDFPNPAAVVQDVKLRLAIEICTGHRFEISDNAQFVTLVTALEALLRDMDIAPSASEALGAAHAAVLEVRKKHPADSIEWSQVTHLLSRLGKLQQEAIGTSMRQFAVSAVQRHPDLGTADSTSTALRDAYSIRSRLLHEGRVDSVLLNEKLMFLRQFVPKLLRALFVETAGK